MNTDQLTNLLAEAARTAGAPPASQNRPSWVSIDQTIVAAFAHGLATHPDLQSLWGKWAVTPSGGQLLSPDSTAIYLVDRARCGVSAREIVDSLITLVASNEVNVTSVRVVDDITASQAFDLGSGARLVPESDLPATDQRHFAFTMRRGDGRERDSSIGGVALTIDTIIAPFQSPPPKDPSGFQPPITLDPSSRTEIERGFAAAENALILVADAAPVLSSQYAFVSAPGWPIDTGSGVGGAWPAERQPTLVKQELAEALSANLMRLRDPHPTILLAIKRLHRLRTRNDEVEKAIDLGSCLEMLLMHNEDSGNSEITNKISHRGAWLLGNDVADRKIISATIKAVYTLRSKAVHNGKLPVVNNMDAMNKRMKTLRDGEALVVRLIERLSGGWPDWAEITLGGNATADASKA